MWLVVGLGNPGPEYAATRHNAGFMVVQSLAHSWDLQLKERAFKSRVAESKRGRANVILALPQTFMNLSGLAVKALMAGFRVKPEKLIVVYDDLDLELGEIRVRAKGSPGSHRGMQSIVQEIGTELFPRVRVGIGPKPENLEAAVFVLSEFSEEERAKLAPALARAQEAVEMIISGHLPLAMNLFNRKKRLASA